MDQTRRKLLIAGLGAAAFVALDLDIGLAKPINLADLTNATKKGFFWLSSVSYSPPTLSTGTKAPNGDAFPVAVAVVPTHFPTDGLLQPNDFLVSNNADANGLLNQGSTIMRVGPTGETSVFFSGQPGVGLRRGLGVLEQGYVVAAS